MTKHLTRTLAALLAVVMIVFSSIQAVSTPHDFHVCITQIDCNPAKSRLEFSVKIFTDDIEASLEMLGAPKLRLGAQNELPRADSIIGKYLEHRFTASVGGRKLPMTYLGKSVELDAMYCFLSAPLPPSGSEILFYNRILFELFDDQSNLLNLSCGGEKTSDFCTQTKPESFLTLKF